MVSTAGIISTAVNVAGSSGFSGDDGAASSATLNSPANCALDSSGNLFLADQDNGRVRKVTKTGNIITTFAGAGTSIDKNILTGGLTAVGLFPFSLFIDSNAHLYVGEIAVGRVRKTVLGSGILTTYAGFVGEKTTCIFSLDEY